MDDDGVDESLAAHRGPVMCGIAGWVEPGGGTIDEGAIRAMTRALAHRGPEGEGVHVEPGCGLGHRRLAMIDPQRGNQPMADTSGAVRLVANSEIYNYVELRRLLLSRGHHLGTGGDTEVIVHLYEDLGLGCIDPLVGMFAFALWDRRERTLLLARDRFGVKPLYYYRDDHGGLRFASEMRALLATPGIDDDPDSDALAGYLRDLAIPEPATLLRRVRKVPPGHYLRWRDGDIVVERYWGLPDRAPATVEASDSESEIERLLLESTALTMRSDVRLGLFLSGGLDSSLLAWAMRETGTEPVRTFSVAFAESPFDESRYSRMVAAVFETEHRELRVGRDDAAEAALLLAEWFDEPFADSSAIPTYLLAQHASREVKGVLTGEGADELFAGSPWHEVDAPSGGPYSLLAPPGRGPFTEQTLAALLGGELGNGGATARDPNADMPAGLDSLHRRLFADLSLYLPADLLTKIDRMSMRCSLEARVPYLNHPFAEAVWALPSTSKLDGRTRKALLRRIARRHLPAAIIERPKQGFSIPIDIWLWQPGRFRDAIYDTLRDVHCRSRSMLDFTVVDSMLDDHDRARRMNGHALWSLFVLERWLRKSAKAPELQ